MNVMEEVVASERAEQPAAAVCEYLRGKGWGETTIEMALIEARAARLTSKPLTMAKIFWAILLGNLASGLVAAVVYSIVFASR